MKQSISQKIAITVGALAAATSSALVAQQPAESSTGSPLELDPVIITASRTEHPAALAPATISVVAGTDLLNGSSGNLLDDIRLTAGLNLNGRGVGGRKVFMIRGMESHHSLILVNGRRISATDEIVGHSDFQYNWAPTQTVERIEIVRGPMSALYGSEAMGGVVNIITASPTPSRWSGLVDLEGSLLLGGDGGERGSLLAGASGPLAENLTLNISANYQHLAETPDPDNPQVSELEGQRLRGLNTAVRWDATPDHRFEFYANLSTEDRWRDTIHYTGAAYRSTYILDRRQIGLRWEPRFGAWTGHVEAYESDTDVQNRATNGVLPYSPQHLNDRIVDASFTRPLSEDHLLTVGGEWRREYLEHPAFINGSDSVRHAAAYIQDEWHAMPSLRLTGAVRFDHHGRFGAKTSPRAYIVWEVSPRWIVKGGYGSGFKAPTLKQSSDEYKFVGHHTFMGNSDLDPESSDTWELSTRFRATDTFVIGITAFRNEVRDLITTRRLANAETPYGNVYQYINLERARIDGLETELTWMPVDRVMLRASHTWLDATNRTSGTHLPGRPDHRITAQLNVDVIPERFSAALTWERNGREWILDTTGETRLPAYGLLGASFRYVVDRRNELILNLTNLTDERLADLSPDFGYAERGRSVSLRWRTRF